MMSDRFPLWVQLARKDPQTGTIGGRIIEVGAPDPSAGEVFLTVSENGTPVGHVLPTDPPTYRSVQGGAVPEQVDSMEDLLALLVPPRREKSPRGTDE